MKKYNDINNLEELKARQAILAGNQAFLSKKIIRQAPRTLITSPVASFLTPTDPLSYLKIDRKTNVPAKVLTYLLPLIINRTLLRRSGLMTKLIVGIVISRLVKRRFPEEH
ncbi:hypothetical protein ACSBL2_24700 [Pedobacter sp. AW31-3R]|uniref:hypothetical protein n=1 Tax=Pedobacter sp. AW31-3R TaxID=3445781 RepID=UPI003FA16CB0